MIVNIVVIDSNFILLPFQFKIDYLNEIKQNIEGRTRFLIYKQNLDELESKRKRESKSTKYQQYLKAGLLYLEKNKENYNIVIDNKVKSNYETTDDFLIKQCRNLRKEYKYVFLATNDSELRKRAKKNMINLIFLRQKKFLSFERA